MCISILSLSKIARQMWCDHPFSQRNMTTERMMEVRVGGDKEVGEGARGGGKSWKMEGGVGNIGSVWVKRTAWILKQQQSLTQNF